MAANEDRLAAQVLASLGSGCIAALQLDPAEVFLRQALENFAKRNLDAPRLFETGWLAHLELMRGRGTLRPTPLPRSLRAGRTVHLRSRPPGLATGACQLVPSIGGPVRSQDR
jgi:hypothetical protein